MFDPKEKVHPRATVTALQSSLKVQQHQASVTLLAFAMGMGSGTRHPKSKHSRYIIRLLQVYLIYYVLHGSESLRPNPNVFLNLIISLV